MEKESDKKGGKMVQWVMKPQKIEISYKTIVFTVIFLLFLNLLWQIKDILVLVFLCLILMLALGPVVNRLEKMKMPRAVAILLVYLVMIGIVILTLALVIPILIEQTGSLIAALPGLVDGVKVFGLGVADLNAHLKLVESLPGNIAKVTLGLVSNVFSLFVMMVITFYLLMDRKNFGKYAVKLMGTARGKIIQKVFDMAEERLGRWVTAEVLLMTIVGLLSYVGYLVIGLNYVVPLAILAGLLEIVPNIGPTIATAAAVLVGLTVQPVTGLLALVLGIVIQQLENNFIVPKLMKETVGLNSLMTILLIAAGAKIGGVLGALLAIPTYLMVEVVMKVMMEKKD